MKDSILITIHIILFAFLFNGNITFAQTASGKIIYTQIQETRPVPKSINGVTFKTETIKARVETDDKNSPFNGATGVCENWIVPLGDGNAFAHGVCILADKDGDTFVTYSTLKIKDKTATLNIKGGTGKFLKLDGIGQHFGQKPANTGKVEDCCMIEWKLEYKM